jgi:hypothetical protein
MADMINWPVRTGLYDDSGEGGMFAYLVVSEPQAPDDACHVDVHAFLSEPDVRLPYRMAEPRLWGSEDYHDRARTKLHAARAALERAGEDELAKSLAGLRGDDELSLPLRAAVFLGATGASLVHRGLGGYFEATPGDLTVTGRAVYEALAKEHGERAVHIITFLDT